MTETALEFAQAIRDRRIGTVEAAEAAIAAADDLEPSLNAFSFRDDEAFLARAAAAQRALDRGDALGPFHGVPLPIKDVHAVEGQPNTKGSWALGDERQPKSDLFVERCIAAGFLPFGRTTTSELASSHSCESPRYGITRNPWATSLTPGGSSGGSAVAVAAGYAPIATATDGGGSIRIPASATGLVGLKPSRGLFPHRAANWEGSSVDGVLTRTIDDTAAAFDALGAPDPLAWTRSTCSTSAYLDSARTPMPRGLRIGIMLESPNGAAVAGVCAGAAADVAKSLEAAGATVVPVSAEIIRARAMELFVTVFMSAGMQVNSIADRSLLQPYLRRRLELSDQLTVQHYLRSTLEMKELLRGIVAHWHDDFDVLLTPAMAQPVPACGLITSELNEGIDGTNSAGAAMAAFMLFVNATGQPAISLPTHLDERGVPLGVQLVARAFEEPLLLSIGARLEREYGWARRRPPTHARS